MTGFGVFTEREGDVVRLLVTGELDHATVATLDRAARRVEYDRPAVVVFDLRGTAHLDSSALGCLVEADLRARRDGRRLVIIPAPGIQQRLFRMGLLAHLEVTDEPGDVLPGRTRELRVDVEDVDRLRAGYEAFNRRDFDAFLDHIEPDAEWWVDALPEPQLYEGPHGARAYCEQMAELFDEWKALPEEFLVSGDEVVARGTITVGGGAASAPFVHVWKLREGRAARVQLLGRPDGLRVSTGTR